MGSSGLILSNVYRKLSEAEVTLLLRIADHSGTEPPSVAGLRSKPRELFVMRHRFSGPAMAQRPRLLPLSGMGAAPHFDLWLLLGLGPAAISRGHDILLRLEPGKIRSASPGKGCD